MTTAEAAALAKDVGDLLIRGAVEEIGKAYAADPTLARDAATMQRVAPAAAKLMAAACALYAISATLAKVDI